jgi:hypothetical protein
MRGTMPTGKGGGRTGWPQKEAVVRDDAPTCWWRMRGLRARCCWLGTLVHTASIVAVLETFSLALFSAASARGQWKSSFPLAVILEPPVEMICSLAVFLSNHQWKCYFHWRFVLFSRQWKVFPPFFLIFNQYWNLYIFTHTKHIYIYWYW